MEQHKIKINLAHIDDEEFYNKYYNTTLDLCDKFNIDSNKTDKELEIYITTFDGLIYVKYQIKMLKAFLKNINFNIVFCDTNSHINPEVSQNTKELCINENVSYIKMPHNKFQDLSLFSDKLGTDMTWIWRNVIKIRQPKYFGYLDQDCFLIKDIWSYLKNYLDNKGMYGYTWPAAKDVSIDKTYWLIHIMNNFFKYDFVKDLDLDFRPYGHIGLDTGGCNYFTLFKNYNREDYLQNESLLSNHVGKQWEDVFRCFELQDDERWIHIMNSTKSLSGNPNEKLFKEIYMTGLLDGILLNT